MSRFFRLRTVVPRLALALTLASAGCNYSSSGPLVLPGEEPTRSTAGPVDSEGKPSTATTSKQGEREEQQTAILDSVVRLIQTASLKPGGNNFGNATKNLNQYFDGTPTANYVLDARVKEFLLAQKIPVLTPTKIDELESPTWTMPDARHLEDCMLYQSIASRIAGKGDDLTRVRRVFDWVVQQIQLVPAGSLAAPNLGQAYARPYDVLLRGLATETDGGWVERSWVFISLCRQLGLDSGLITYTTASAQKPINWCVAVLIDGKAYLFDARIGLPIADAKGDGVATLEEALTQPIVLDRLALHLADLPPYVTRATLLSSPGKLGIELDSSLRYFSPRMRLLQQHLAGKNLTILYRDPAEQRDQFAKAFGDSLGAVTLWDLPVRVETLLFTNPQFVASTQAALSLFRPELPLIYARLKQLRGETPEAILDYVKFRFAEHATLTDGKTAMPPEVQKALDIYSTHFLGMCHLEQKNAKLAESFFLRALKLIPAPGDRLPYFFMFRWGAQSNLARLDEAKGNFARATAFYSQPDPTPHRLGNLLRARDLVWRDPTALRPDPLPPPPSLNEGMEAVSIVK